MTSADVFSKMRPSTLVDFIAGMDEMDPEDYNGNDIRILEQATMQLIALVGVHDAIEMLAEVDVDAQNGVIDMVFDQAISEAQS